MKYVLFYSVRRILTLLLIYAVYLESGKWTALFAFLTSVALELNTLSIRNILKFINPRES